MARDVVEISFPLEECLQNLSDTYYVIGFERVNYQDPLPYRVRGNFDQREEGPEWVEGIDEGRGKSFAEAWADFLRIARATGRLDD